MTRDLPTAREELALHTLTVDAVTVRVMRWLGDSGIRTILLKGGALRSWLYDSGELRAYGDVDVLVDPAQIDAAISTMTTRGWTESEYPSAIGHAVHLRPPAHEPPIPLDLHRTFHYFTAPPIRVWELLSARAVPIRLAGRDVETLDESGLAVIVALHHVGHGAAARPSEDLARAVARSPLGVWRDAADLAAALGAAEAFAAGVRDVRGGAELADALELAGASDPNVHLALVSPPPTARSLLRLRQAGFDPAALLRIVASELLPPPMRMREHYPLARRGAIGLLVAYVLRPFRRAPALVTGWRAARAAQASAAAASGSGALTRHAEEGRLRLAGEILMTYVKVRRGLRRKDARSVLRDLRDVPLERRPAADPTNTEVARRVATLARETVRVMRGVPRDRRRMSQALVLSVLLAQRGVASCVVVAVGDPRERSGAEAWVEVDGRAVLPGAGGAEARLEVL